MLLTSIHSIRIERYPQRLYNQIEQGLSCIWGRVPTVSFLPLHRSYNISLPLVIHIKQAGIDIANV